MIGVFRPFKALPQFKRWHYGSLAAAAFVLTGATASNSEQITSDPPKAASSMTAPAPGEAKRKTVIAEAEAAYPAIPMPKGAPIAPTTGLCRDDTCEVLKVQFVNSDWPKAWDGDYQGQRNAAFCRSTGCSGAVQINQAEACAWRALIVQKHAREADDTDAANMKADCSKLDQSGAMLAQGKAADMLKAIYK